MGQIRPKSTSIWPLFGLYWPYSGPILALSWPCLDHSAVRLWFLVLVPVPVSVLVPVPFPVPVSVPVPVPCPCSCSLFLRFPAAKIVLS